MQYGIKSRIFNSNKQYANIATVMLAILCIPDGNLDSETIFSIIRKNDTEYHHSLDPSTISNFMVQKVHSLANDECCKNKNFTNQNSGGVNQ